MPLQELLAHPWSGAATQTLLHFVWQGLAIALGLIAVVELLGLRRPQARYLCSLTALLLMTACPLVTFAWLAQAEGTGDRGQGTEIAAAAATFGTSVLLPNQWQTADIVTAAQPYVLAAWLAGVAFFACRLLIGLVGVGRLGRQRLPLSRELSDRVEQLGRRLGMRARSMVFLSRRVGEAMAVGLVKPIVLIPAAWATEMPLAMVEAVIAHELAHLQRQDLWVNLLQRVVETLLFYHPAVWWLSRRLRAERELCCDELAVALTGRRLEYVQALESVARLGTRVEPLFAAGIRGERNMQLLERVRNVLGLSAAGQSSRLWPAGLVALLLPLAAWAWSVGLVTPQPAVAVADDDREDADKPAAKEGDRERDDDDDKPAKKGDKERDDDEGDKKEVRKEGERKDGEGEPKKVRKEGDKPVKEGARGGERKIVRKEGEKPVKEGAKDGEERKIIRKDGEKPIKIAPKDGEKPVKIGAKDGEKPGKEGEGRIAELMIAVKKLTAENERLQAELFKLRGGKKEAAVSEKEALIKRAAGEKEAAVREKEGAAREKEAFIKRAAAEKEEAVARERKIKEGAERKELEIRERKIKEGDDKEAAIRRELIEKKKAEAAERERKEGD